MFATENPAEIAFLEVFLRFDLLSSCEALDLFLSWVMISLTDFGAEVLRALIVDLVKPILAVPKYFLNPQFEVLVKIIHFDMYIERLPVAKIFWCNMVGKWMYCLANKSEIISFRMNYCEKRS